MAVVGVLVAVVVIVVFAAIPSAWLVMLALGNFGFSQFGLIDCIPAGLIVAWIASAGANSK